MTSQISIRYFDAECGQFTQPETKTFETVEQAEEFCYEQNENWGGSLSLISITGGTSERLTSRYGIKDALEDLLQEALEDKSFIELVGEAEANRINEDLDIQAFELLLDSNQYPVDIKK